MAKKTDNPKSYTSTQDVYVEHQYFKAGQPFVTDDEPADHWTEVTPVEAHTIAAATDPTPADAPLESLGVEALKAVAVTKHINVMGMSKADLITAIKAADEPRL